MAYSKQTWVDRSVENPLTFKVVNNADGSITLIPFPGTIQNEGSKMTADRLNHMEEGISNSVDKSGDVMTGALQLKNLNVFDGLIKYRTIEGKTYKGKLGIGINKTLAIEFGDNDGNILGRLDITSDGKILNQKTGKYLVEENIKSGTIANPDKTKFNIKRSRIVQVNDIVFIDLSIELLADIPANTQFSFQVSNVDVPKVTTFPVASYGVAEWKLTEAIYSCMPGTNSLYIANQNSVSAKGGFWNIHFSYPTI